MTAAWASIIVALISGPIMWVLFRLDKRNTEQHGKAVNIIQEVRDMQVWTNLKLDQHIDLLNTHLEDHKDAS